VLTLTEAGRRSWLRRLTRRSACWARSSHSAEIEVHVHPRQSAVDRFGVLGAGARYAVDAPKIPRDGHGAMPLKPEPDSAASVLLVRRLQFVQGATGTVWVWWGVRRAV